jgi:hypothetical protein
MCACSVIVAHVTVTSSTRIEISYESLENIDFARVAYVAGKKQSDK